MEIKFKKLNDDAEIPRYANPGDAGLDLKATGYSWFTDYIEYRTGLAVEIPPGFVGLLFPRSSVTNFDLVLGNSVGVIDSGYRGEIKFRYKLIGKGEKTYDIGDRVGQLVIVPCASVKPVEAETLSDTVRGGNGYGSTG